MASGSLFRKLRSGLSRVRNARRPRLIIDRRLKLGDFRTAKVGYDVSLKKEEFSRQHIFALPGDGLRFLDVGARDGRLDYLLGIRSNLEFDGALYQENLERFQRKFEYFGLDLAPEPAANVITADVCSETFGVEHSEYLNFFDVIYSNNVFEHLRRPWIAAANLLAMLAPGGICITITPFSLRYHEVPGDFFRYTHAGLTALFEDAGEIEVVASGYDITGRRNNWQGTGLVNDIVPTDAFGAWRENWFAVAIVKKNAA